MEVVLKLLTSIVKPILSSVPTWAWVVLVIVIIIWYALDWIEYSG